MSVTAEEYAERLRHAEDKGLRNELGLLSHEKECAIRYNHINETMTGMHRSVASVRREFRLGLYSLVGLLVAALGFLIKLTVFK